MKDYSQVMKKDLIKDLERMKTVTKADILDMLTKAYNLGLTERDKFYYAKRRGEYVYDRFMLQNFGITQKELKYYVEQNLPF